MDYCIAALCGFAEATFFFLIPDIYLTWLTITNTNKAFKASLVAAAAATVGGSIMYCWGALNSHQAYHFLTFIPAISLKLVLYVDQLVKSPHPLWALFIAPFKGIPYKIYAVAFGAYHLNKIQFIAVSFIARSCRFFLVTSLSVLFVSLLEKRLDRYHLKYLHVFIWAIIYAGYFLRQWHYYH